MGRKEKPRTMAERNSGLCGSICLCQLTAVLSSVALIYLSVAIYMPSHRAFHSGFETVPVMCQTIKTTLANNCAWASCGEWCLTKTSGFCPQIVVTVRRNASVLLLENCTRPATVSCPAADPTTVKRYNCNLGSECGNLNGVFNCSLGHCGNWSELFQCHHKADGITVDSEKDNMKLNGFFECKRYFTTTRGCSTIVTSCRSRCTRIRKPFSCDRFCNRIPTVSSNVFVFYENNVLTADCRRALASPHDNSSQPKEVWRAGTGIGTAPGGGNASILFASCAALVRIEPNSYQGIDCLNGSLLDEPLVPKPNINFTTLWGLAAAAMATRLVDTEVNVTVTDADNLQFPLLPPQSALVIYNQTRLYINLEGCVNTLRGECSEFVAAYGRDGSNQTAQSRFPCYYNKKESFMAVARFDLNKTFRELLIATLVPSVLFVVSFATLVAITKYVRVNDDGRMRCTMCDGCCGRGADDAELTADDVTIGIASAPPSDYFCDYPKTVPGLAGATAPPMEDWCADASDEEIFVPVDLGPAEVVKAEEVKAEEVKAEEAEQDFDPTLIIVTPADN